MAPKVEVPAWAASESALRLVVTRRDGRSQRGRADVFAAHGLEIGPRAAQAHRRRARVVGRCRRPRRDASTRWRYPLASAAPGYPVPVPIGDEEHPTRGVVGRLLRAQRVLDSFPPRVESTIVFFLRDAEFSRLAPATGSYRGRFHVTLTRHDIEARLPLRPGATHHGGAYRVVVDDVERTSAASRFSRASRMPRRSRSAARPSV